MKSLLAIAIFCFFVLMCIYIIILIIDAIFFIVYQKKDRVYFNFLLYCNVEKSYFTLKYKNKKIDDIFIYGKYKKHYYFIGRNGVYKLKKFRIQEIQEAELQKDEKDFIYDMIKERKLVLLNSKRLIEDFLAKFENIDDGELYQKGT